jgi:hypothetical protein
LCLLNIKQFYQLFPLQLKAHLWMGFFFFLTFSLTPIDDGAKWDAGGKAQAES